MKRKIVLTGGGTAGHVALHQAIIPYLVKDFDVFYIGSHNGIEKELITSQFPDVPYFGISSGKLRRYISRENMKDPFKVVKGVFDAISVLRKIKPDLIFSKGGFVTVPVVLAGKLLSIPTVIHESDVTPGLANKISIPMATHIYSVFEKTLAYLPKEKSSAIGAIVRDELFTGNKQLVEQKYGLDPFKKTLLVMGGSQGSVLINSVIRENLSELLNHVQIVHLCGKGKIDETLTHKDGYLQFEYVTTELKDFLAASHIIVSRAGSNSIFEFLALNKPMLLIPLSKSQSRGDQVDNAYIFKEQGYALVVEEEQLNNDTFLKNFHEILKVEDEMKTRMNNSAPALTPAEMVAHLTTFIK